MFQKSGIAAIAAVVAILSVTSSVAAAAEGTTPASFGNGSHLYDYLYGDRSPRGAEDGWAQLIELFNSVVYNTGPGGHTEPRGQRTRRQAFNQPGRGGRDLNSLFDYPGQSELLKTHRQEQEEEEEEEEREEESLPFMGDVAFAFPLVILDIPFTGIEIPMFDYNSRNYYDSVK